MRKEKVQGTEVGIKKVKSSVQHFHWVTKEEKKKLQAG
jgi:hypothetical protein